jgi:DEAD/DEAH box helicase domain-containing protein
LEIASEFGLNAQIGRTLERRSFATFFKAEQLEEAFDAMESWMKENQMEPLAQKEVFCRFLNGLLHSMRVRGAVDHELHCKAIGRQN